MQKKCRNIISEYALLQGLEKWMNLTYSEERNACYIDGCISQVDER
jgi:hypothetical protein